MSSPFDQVLDALVRPEAELPRADLTFLSDLDAPQLERFRALWETFDGDRRRRILKELGRLAKEHIELNFDRVDRMALTDPSGDVRRTAIDNLWECEDPGLVPALIRVLRTDPEPAVRAAAAGALGAFVYLGELDRLPPGALPPIEESLLAGSRDSDRDVRLRAIESLGYSSRPEVPIVIRAAYQSGEEAQRRSALLAMARSADEVWMAQVLTELRSPSPALRLEAVKAAGELELSEAVPDLIDLLEDAGPGIRRATIWSLGQIGGKRSAEVLSRLLDVSEDDEAGLLGDALDQLAFVEGTRDLSLLDVDEDSIEEDGESLLEDDGEDEEDEEDEKDESGDVHEEVE